MDTLNIKINNIKNIVSADIEFPFDNGIYTIVGSNGCGKSTLLKIIAGMEDLDKGEIHKEKGCSKPGNMYCDSDIYAVVSEPERKIYVMDFKILKANYLKGKYRYIDWPQ